MGIGGRTAFLKGAFCRNACFSANRPVPPRASGGSHSEISNYLFLNRF